MKFVVTSDKAYYPDVDYFDTLEEAIECKNRYIEMLQEEAGDEITNVCISIMIEKTEIKTY